ncbi:TPA: hypothetical protein MM109_004746 [Klebsiella pneumoniae]|uniref:hypothetical protein n=1 Tax=Klebsiella TaxID=570 RepID=UPI0008698705|nr:MULTISPECIES: hypothetical protein [Klebsiella]HBR1002242.1 hypothetical protein [Klebsiella quasipneumoniae subsp. quasipneumoniae]HBT4807891.1 hypothetical protein [Klebsiella variicola subsp. variicola]HDU3637354.1 hypothetical protein [Klebsiella pneumoniae subsp. pneumoniae]MBD0989424.1 hypothetical protein [Klebsiella michiganensis]MCB3042822.1 hypothetical protein [Klebsiella pneumoniae]
MAINKERLVNELNDYARIRVGSRGGAYIPSEEIANLPEVKDMQQRAAAIVGRTVRVQIAQKAKAKDKA